MALRKGNAPVAAIEQRSCQLQKPEDLMYPNQLWMDACWRPLRGIRPLNASSSNSRQGSTRSQISTVEKIIEETLHPTFGNPFHQNADWMK
jgi:hypothetical protein